MLFVPWLDVQSSKGSVCFIQLSTKVVYVQLSKVFRWSWYECDPSFPQSLTWTIMTVPNDKCSRAQLTYMQWTGWYHCSCAVFITELKWGISNIDMKVRRVNKMEVYAVLFSAVEEFIQWSRYSFDDGKLSNECEVESCFTLIQRKFCFASSHLIKLLDRLLPSICIRKIILCFLP